MEPERKLILYVDPAWKREGHQSTPLLFPFWGNPFTELSLFAKEMFDAHPFDTRYYRITEDIGEADMVLAPYKYQWFLRHEPSLWTACLSRSTDAGLPLLLDAASDIDYPIPAPNVYTLKIGGYRFQKEERRIQIPPASDDLLERCAAGELRLRVKREGEKPVIGFAGWAHLTFLQRLKVFLKEFPTRARSVFDRRYAACKKGVLWRERATRLLAASPKVTTNFKLRGSFSGSAKTAEGDMRQLRQELVDTLLESDYGLDVRGDANDSTRFFEILSLGRIPVMVDTERNLPFSDHIDYKDFCVFVDFRDIERLPDIIAEFHRTVSPERFLDMQRRAREAFVSYLRIDALMPHIIEELVEEDALPGFGEG